MTEHELMSEIRDLLVQYRLRFFWPGPDSRKGWGPGYPDLTIVGQGFPLFREVKGDDGTVDGQQKAWGYAFRAAGFDWAVWWPADFRSGRIELELKEIA